MGKTAIYDERAAYISMYIVRNYRATGISKIYMT